MNGLCQEDRDEINEYLEELNEILSKYQPSTKKMIQAVVCFIFLGIAYVAISVMFNELIGTIALCVLSWPFIFGNKIKDELFEVRKEQAIEALIIMQHCMNIFKYPREGTLRYVGYSVKYDYTIYKEFVEHFPKYKNTKLKRLIKNANDKR